MELYIKQKVFTWSDKFTVYDAQGNDRYYVEGELFSFGKKLHVYDTYGSEVMFISQKVMSFMPKYYIFIDGMEVAEISKHFSLFSQRYSISGLGWRVEGIWHDYSVMCGDRMVLDLHKRWMTWGDSYELSIFDPDDELMALAVVLVIDCVMDANN